MKSDKPTNGAFEVSVGISDGDIDRLGHVNNVVYVRWVQEAAVAHWKAVASPDEQSDILWVVLRHEIQYERPAGPGDAIIARTWVGAAEALRFERHTEILRAGDGKLLAKALTEWCPINPGTGKPKRVSQEIRDRFSAGRSNAREEKRNVQSG